MALFEGDAMTLRLKAKDIEFIYDDLDTNALNFNFGETADTGISCFQARRILEEDEASSTSRYIEMERTGECTLLRHRANHLPAGSNPDPVPADRPYLGKVRGCGNRAARRGHARDCGLLPNNYLYSAS